MPPILPSRISPSRGGSLAPHATAMKLPPRATSSSSAIGAHKWSHAIAKAPPRKIRIVHVLAPEVIKTDVRHFRELVQRLTGKPAGSDGGGSSASEGAASQPDSPEIESEEGAVVVAGGGAAATIKAEMKEEAEAEASLGGFLRALGEEDSNDVFFQGLEDFLFSPCNMDRFSF